MRAYAPPPVRFRRRDGEGAVLAAGLLTGCLLGAALSWQTVLSDGARRQLSAAVLGDLVGAADAPAVAGMSGGPARPYAPAARQDSGPGPATDADPRAARPTAGRSAAPLPERLVLAERETGPSMAVGAEVVFDVNSSFMGPEALAALRRLAAELRADPGARQLRLRATVGTDGVRGADPREAQRYNRWLAERRADRVAGWLRRSLPGLAAVGTEFVRDDSSRRVSVMVRPGR